LTVLSTLQRSDAIVALGLGGSLLAYYFATPIWAWVPAALAFLALAVLRLDLAVLAVIATAPFYRFPKAFDPALLGLARVEPLRFSLAEFAVIACLGAWVLQLWSVRRGQLPPLPYWRDILSPPVAFLAAATLTLPFSQYLGFSLRSYRTVIIEPLIFYFLLRQTVRDEAAVRRAIDVLLSLGLAVGAFALFHYMFIGVTEATGGVRRVLAVYHSPNALALFLGRIIPIALALLFTPTLWRRLLALATAATSGVALVLTFSRGAWLAVAGAVVALGWLLGGYARWAALATVALAMALAVTLLPGERLRSETTVSQRLYIWEASVQMLADHPILGVGLDNFLYYYPDYILPAARNEPNMSHPHNFILDFWLSTGVLGLASFLWLQVTFWTRTGLVLRLASGLPRLIGVGLAASMSETLLHGFIDNSFFLIDLAFLFWLTYALMMAVAEATASGVRENIA
jgi:O-antigen ligase